MHFDISVIAFLLLLMLHILLFQCKPVKGIRESDYLSLRQTNCVKGISALGVLLVHTAAVVPTGLFDFMMTYSGSLFVALFLFYSGYGTMFQFKAKGEEYLRGLPGRKLKRILAPWGLLALMAPLYYALGAPSTEALISPYHLGVYLERLGEWVPNGWFIFVILLFDLVFYGLARMRLKKTSTLLLLFGVFTVVYMRIMYLLGMGFWWYTRSHCFLMGLVWREYEDKILAVVKRHFWIWWSVLALCVVPLYLRHIRINEAVFTTAVMLMVFVALVQLTCMKVAFENPILDFLGKISMEIYLLHGFVLGMLHSKAIYITQNWLFALLALMLSIDLAALMHKMMDHSRRRNSNAAFPK